MPMLAPALAFSVFALIAAISAVVADFPRPVIAHAFFATAALPLMLAAILHFVPVLTRSGGAGRLVLLPWFAIVAGLILLAALVGVIPRHALLAAALIDAAAAATVWIWMLGRIRRSLGSPHPGVRWYLGSIGFLLLGMVAVFGMVFAADVLFWRNLHLHANLFGWIGLTALGTLPVLLPTALGRPEPQAAARLRRDLPLAAAGVVVMAFASAWSAPVAAAAGAVMLAAVAVRHLLAWRTAFGAAGLCRGVGLALVLATGFLVVLLAVGIVHGFAAVSGGRLVPAFAVGFLLPLVTGALAQLLPVWRFAGPNSAGREGFRLALARHAGARALAFVAAGGMLLGGVAWMEVAAMLLAALAMAAFVLTIARHWRVAEHPA